MSHTSHGNQSKTAANEKDYWRTPIEAFNDAQRLVGETFILDAAASKHNTLCNLYLDEDDDALLTPWNMKRQGAVWCNPPFSRKKEFLEKAYFEAKTDWLTVCVLIPYEPATKWWREYVDGRASVVYVPDGRYNYRKPTGEQISGCPFASCFVIFTGFMMPTQYVHFERTK